MRTEFVYGHGVIPTIGQDRLPGRGQSRMPILIPISFLIASCANACNVQLSFYS